MPSKSRDQLLEQFQRLDVEIVGRLVEHQDVGRPREEPGQQQPVALAARQRLDRRQRALAREQKIREVADDVPRLAVDDDRVVAVVDAVGDRPLGIELLALLIEVRDLERGPLADVPVSGASSRLSSLSSVVLPDPFGPMRPTRSPRRIAASSPG